MQEKASSKLSATLGRVSHWGIFVYSVFLVFYYLQVEFVFHASFLWNFFVERAFYSPGLPIDSTRTNV